MKKLSVSELAKLYGYSRQAIYVHINKGNLSKWPDGLTDFAEALRVFGEPQKKEQTVNQSKSIDSQNLTEIDMLERQLNQSILRENQSLEREIFYQEQIEAMQRLLEAPKVPKMEDPTSVAPLQETIETPIPDKPIEVGTEIQTPNKRIPVPEQVEAESKKRGFISRFFLPNG
jgi:predicted DNA-binding protein YlxM (UPF0122 family)